MLHIKNCKCYHFHLHLWLKNNATHLWSWLWSHKSRHLQYFKTLKYRSVMTYFPACERITVLTCYGWRLDVLQSDRLSTKLFLACLFETCQKSASTVAMLQSYNSVLKQKIIRHNFLFPLSFFLYSHVYIAKWKKDDIDITCQYWYYLIKAIHPGPKFLKDQ